jgi:hypothetical protein
MCYMKNGVHFWKLEVGQALHICVCALTYYDSEVGHSFVFILWVQSSLVTALTDLAYCAAESGLS